MQIKTGLIVLALLPLFGYGQIVSSQVTNLAATEATLGSYVITSSIGEPAVATFSSDAAILTQGFLQPELLPCEKFEFRYFPNPAVNWVTLEADGCETAIESVQLIDLWGRILYKGKLSASNELFIGDLSQGMYTIQATLTNGSIQSIHLIKIAE